MTGIYDGPGNPTHGLASTYRAPAYRCRCKPCCDANTTRHTAEQQSRQARLAEDSSLAAHGTSSTYINWGCRCESCSAAMAVKNKAGRDRRRARRGAPA